MRMNFPFLKQKGEKMDLINKEELFKKMNSANVDTVYEIVKKNQLILNMHEYKVKQGSDQELTLSALQAFCALSGILEGETGCIITKVALDLLFSMIDMRLRMEYEAEKGEKEDEN